MRAGRRPRDWYNHTYATTNTVPASTGLSQMFSDARQASRSRVVRTSQTRRAQQWMCSMLSGRKTVLYAYGQLSSTSSRDRSLEQTSLDCLYSMCIVAFDLAMYNLGLLFPRVGP